MRCFFPICFFPRLVSSTGSLHISIGRVHWVVWLTLLSAGVSGFVSGKHLLVASKLHPGTQSEFVSFSQPQVSRPRTLLYDPGCLVRKQPHVVSILPPAPQPGFVGVPHTRVLSTLPSATQSVSPEGKRLVVITRTPVTSVIVSPQRALGVGHRVPTVASSFPPLFLLFRINFTRVILFVVCEIGGLTRFGEGTDTLYKSTIGSNDAHKLKCQASSAESTPGLRVSYALAHNQTSSALVNHECLVLAPCCTIRGA